MRGCHNCEHATGIAEGTFAGRAWEDIPCSTCDVMSGAGFAIEFNENRAPEPSAFAGPTADRSARCPAGLGGDGDHEGRHGHEEGEQTEDRLPVGVMREIVVGLLKLKPELRDVVAWRFAGMRYADIALAQGVTQACAEKRHRRAMELWPALRALFPRKVAKQTMRKPVRQRLRHGARQGHGERSEG